MSGSDKVLLETLNNSFHQQSNNDIHFNENTDDIDTDGVYVVSKDAKANLKHPEYAPSWDPTQKYEALTPFDHVDPGARANSLKDGLDNSLKDGLDNSLKDGLENSLKDGLDNSLKDGLDNSLKNAFDNLLTGATIKAITPKFGSEVRGIQLSALDAQAKDQLALYVAQRGVVVFRDQDWAERGPKYISDYGRHFGRLHIHPTSGAPKGHPELHITFRRPDPHDIQRTFSNTTNMVRWHSDTSYELQPPGTTFFAVLEGPESGGDTIFADTVEAYKRLSPEFQKRLDGLHVLHSSLAQASNSVAHGGIQRRKPTEHIHPLVRVHPATGEKALYVNRGFGRRIVELKNEESDALLNFLYKHIESAHDLQLRASWEPRTVVVWDNRRTVHSAIVDWDTPVVRHAVRVSPQAERPVGAA